MANEARHHGHERPSAVPSDGGPSAKKPRVTQACEQCRARRTKCDGRRPSCALCEAHAQACVYDPSPKKRGVAPGTNTVLERKTILLELILAYLSKRVISFEQMVKSFMGQRDHVRAGTDTVAAKGQSLLDDWKKSQTYGLVQDLALDPLTLESFWQSISGNGKYLATPNLSETVNLKQSMGRQGIVI